MGGVPRFDYPKYVWAPTGGWWCNPRGWQRSTAVAVAGIAAVSYLVTRYADANTVCTIHTHSLTQTYTHTLTHTHDTHTRTDTHTY